MGFGWTGRILTIDVESQGCRHEKSAPYQPGYLGGLGFGTKYLYDRLDRRIDPFDPTNILCIAPGLLAGTPSPSSSRTTITALSPRGLIDSSGIGGFVGAEIKFAGYDLVAVHGRASTPVYLLITDHGVDFIDASRLWGMDPWETLTAIRDEQGDPNIQALCIGRAGETQVHFAAVITGRMQSAAGRCGMGAILGSKNIKAVAVRGRGSIPVADSKRFVSACLELHKTLRNSPVFEARRGCLADKHIYEKYVKSGKFVVGNWESNAGIEKTFAGLLGDPEAFWKKHARHLNQGRGSQPGCFGCPIYHETFFEIPDHKDIGRTKCTEWLSLGGTVWLSDRHDVNEAVYLVNRYGLDAVSSGNCIAFLMQLFQDGDITASDLDGIEMTRGSLEAVKAALSAIANQTGFGRYFKEGVLGAARRFGGNHEEKAMQIKGLEMFPEEIRAYKSMALQMSVGKVEQFGTLDYAWFDRPEDMETMALERFGSRKTAIPNRYDGKAELVVDSELQHAAGDILGVCKMFMPWGFSDAFNQFEDILSSLTGAVISMDDIRDAARRVFLLTRSMNVARGLKAGDEQPPDLFFEKPVDDGPFKGEVLDRDRYLKMKIDYYALRGLSDQGIPLESSMRELGLEPDRDCLEAK